jgi:hypothetical protein
MQVLIAAHSVAVSIMGLEKDNLRLLVQKPLFDMVLEPGVLRSYIGVSKKRKFHGCVGRTQASANLSRHRRRPKFPPQVEPIIQPDFQNQSWRRPLYGMASASDRWS